MGTQLSADRHTVVSKPLNATLRLARSTNGNSFSNLSSVPTALTASFRDGLASTVGISGSGPITSNPVAGSKPSFANTVPSRRRVGAQMIPVMVGKLHFPYRLSKALTTSGDGAAGLRASFFHPKKSTYRVSSAFRNDPSTSTNLAILVFRPLVASTITEIGRTSLPPD